MSDKKRDDAIREAARNHAGDEYFNADRAYLLVSPYSGRIFDAGFDRGWQAAQSEQSAELERLRKDAERLRDALKYYGTHSSACDMSRFVNPAGCTCGYDAAIAAEGEKECQT